MIAIGEYTISEIFDGQKGEQGISVSKVVTEWTKSTSPTQLPSNPTWSETKPSITSGEYLWYRDRTDLNNGTHSYSNPVCDITISGLVFDVDNINGQITNKIWQSDIATSINQYDNSTVSTLRDRVTTTETNISGVTTRVSDVETSVTNEANKRKAIYGTCSTNADTVAKVVTCQNFELYAGAEISVKFTNTNSTANPTLNVNGTGAKPIKSFTGGNLSASEYGWMAEGVYNFVYDGNNWRLVDNGTVARITSAESSITQNANNINLKVSKDSVISEINASPESITISANKVNIEGATIFSSGRLSTTSLNNAYDAKGSAATAKTEAINSANSATDTKLQSYSTTSQMNTAIGTAVNNAVDDIEANAIKSTVSCYYRSTSNTTPTITKTTSIGTSNNTDNAWEYVMPVPKRNTYFFTCEKYTYMDDSVQFSTVRPLDSQTYASKWVSSSDNTYVDGGRIYTHSITTSQLATDAIKSNNYQASQVTNSPYSATGTFLDLSTGNFYTPNFGIDNTYGKAYLNGEIIASSGQIGSDTTNYWEIGNKTDYNANDSAAIIGHGSSYIQSGGWMISADRIDTRSYDSNRKYTYPLNNNTYWDFGLHVPSLTSNEVYENNFIYIRNHESTIPTLEGNWNYLFRVDRNGGIEATGLKINGTTIQDMITAGVDGGAYLPTSGGTISGNLTVTGTITGLKTLSVNGKTYNGTVDVNVGVIGAAYGGTGQSSLINSANALINALSTGSSTPTDNDYYVSQYVGGGTTTTTYHRRPMSALWTYIKSKINADTDLYTDKFVPKTGGEFTGAITVSDSFTADEATVGNLIVNGAGRFTNGLYGDLIGNADTATKAAKVVDSGNGHDTTFAYSKAGMTSANWIAVWNDYELRAMSPANLRSVIGAQPAGSYVSKTGDTMTGALNIKPASGEGGQINLHASTANTTQAGIAIDQYNSTFRIYGLASADGTTKTGSGSILVVDPYAKTITGGYTITGTLSGNASSATKLNTAGTVQTNLGSTSAVTYTNGGNITAGVTGTLSIANGGTGATTAQDALWNIARSADPSNLNTAKRLGIFKISSTTTNTPVENRWGVALNITDDRAEGNTGTAGSTWQFVMDTSSTDVWLRRITNANEWTSWTKFYSTSNKPTKSDVGLGNVTNNAQVKGLSSGTTSGHFVTWGSDGYTVADSGITAGNVVKSVASNSSGQLVLTYADNTTSAPIDVEFVATETSSVQKAEALNVNGVAIGSATVPVYFDNKGKPQTANTIPKLNNTTTGGTFYAPTGAGTSGQILQSSGGTPSWVNQSTLSVGSATTAGTFTSAASVTLTGDTTGTASSTKGWSIATVTSKLSNIGRLTSANIDNSNVEYTGKLRYFVASSTMTEGKPPTDAMVLNWAWDNQKWGSQLAISANSTPHIYIRGNNNSTWDANWLTVLDSNNYTSYTVTKTGSGASGTWGINISGNANTATSATTATTATNVAWSGITSNPITFSTTAYGTTGWSQLGGTTTPLNSIKVWKPTDLATWGTIAHSAVIAYGCGDTKGMLDISYNSPLVSIAGGNVSGSTDSAPKWYFKLSATSGATYTFPSSSKTLVATDGTGASGTWSISISGNATTATKASQDGSGNVITDTYVTLSTAQTISGAKTFSSAVTFANATWNLMGDDAYIGDCNAAGKIGIKGKNGATGIRLAPYSGSTNQDISIDGSGNLTITGNLKQEGTVTIGSHAKLTYNSTLEALEFSFI